jgi:hypothetical protein
MLCVWLRVRKAGRAWELTLNERSTGHVVCMQTCRHRSRVNWPVLRDSRAKCLT